MRAARVLGPVGTILAALFVASTAFAYFTAAGAGTASASVGTLGAPTITSAVAGAGSVVLSWSSIAPPSGAGVVSYSVARDAGDAAGTCPTSASPGTVTSCTDAGVGAGSHSYTVTARWKTFTATSSASSVTVASGAASKLAVTTQPGGGQSASTWAAQPVVTVQDSAGNTVTGSAASITLAIATQPGSGATLSCTTNPVTASSGVATFAGCKITGAAGTYTLTASASGLTSATTSSFTITSSLHISSLVTGATTGTTQWGGGVTVTVKDVNGAVVSGVAVTGTWNPTLAAAASGCTTNVSGQCTVTAGSTAFPSTQLTDSWTVSGLAATNYTYDSASNSASSITVSRGCAAGAVCATDVGDTFDTASNTSSTSVTLSGANGITPSNSTVLILVARDGTQSTDAISSVTGTAISGATSVNAVGTMSSHPNSFTRAWVYRATGTGIASGTVTVTFNNADNIGTLVEVLVLSGNQTPSPVAQGLTNTGSSNSATAMLTSPSSNNAEIVLVAQGDAATAMGTPSGWTRTFWNAVTGPTGANFGAFYGPSASASQSISLGANAQWGAIALEIARAA